MNGIGAQIRMQKNILFSIMVMAFIGSLLFCPSFLWAETNQERARKTLQTYKEDIDKILLEYRVLPKANSVKQLVDMDQKIRVLMKSMKVLYKENMDEIVKSNGDFFKGVDNIGDDHGDIGLWRRYITWDLIYSGKLLEEAHSRHPNSPYRKYTLFGAIHGDDTHGMPNIKQAKQYLKEFPNGPFVEETHVILAYFYDALHEVLRYHVDGKCVGQDNKCDCFKPYVTKEPNRKQLQNAMSLAITHMEKAVAINPTSEENADRSKFLESMKLGVSEGSHWCWYSDEE